MFSTRLKTLLFIAWRNLWRNKIRSALTISALGGGLAMLILYIALLEGMIKQMSDFATQVSSGVIQVHQKLFVEDQDLYATLPWSLIEEIQNNNPDLKVSPRLYAAGLGSVKESSSGIYIKAIDPKKEADVTVMLQHLRQGVANLDVINQPEQGFSIYGVVVGAVFAKNMNISIDSELVIVSQAADGSIANGLFHVTGILKPIDPTFDRSGVLMSIKAYQDLMYLTDGAHELAVQMKNGEDLLTIQQRLSQQNAHWQESIDGSTTVLVRNWRELMPAVSDMVEASKAATYLLGLIMLGLASMGMVNTTIMSIHERRQEFGILRSLGMGKYWLLLMVMFEAFFISIISALFGTVLGILGALWLQRHGIDLSGFMPDGFDYGGIIFEPVWRGLLNYDSIFISIIFMFVIALLASLIPSWRTVKLKPVEALR